MRIDITQAPFTIRDHYAQRTRTSQVVRCDVRDTEASGEVYTITLASGTRDVWRFLGTPGRKTWKLD